MITAVELGKPYPGPRPFEQAEESLFHGREFEARELVSLVVAHRVVLLYSQSGAGKSSLLNAGLIPLLRRKGFQVLPVARVRGRIPVSIRAEDVANVFAFNAILSWADPTDARQFLRVSLAEYLGRAEARDGEPADVRVLVFDQFEELFTFYPERWRDREPFFRQIAEALDQDPLLRVVFAMREEYCAELDAFAAPLPEQLQARFRLERLGEEPALAAITEPLEGTGRHFTPEAAQRLVSELLKVRVTTEENVVREVTGEFIEPVQLQVVCADLWDDLPADVKQITEDYLGACGDVTEALSGFYEKSIRRAAQEAQVNEGEMRRWFEQALITPAGTRGTVFRGQTHTGAIPNQAVDVLVNQYLVRAESRAGATWYELTHDRFIEPIQKSNQNWRQSRGEADRVLQRLEARAAKWVRLGRPDSGLLSQEELTEAKKWQDSPAAAELGSSDQLLALVNLSQARMHRAEGLRLRRRLALLSAVVLLTVSLALWSLWSHRQADSAREYAEKSARDASEQKKKADEARAEAERQRGLAMDLADKETDSRLRAERAEREARQEARLSFSRELAAAAGRNLSKNPELSLLLALHAMLVEESPEANQALSQAIRPPREILTISPLKTPLQGLAISPDGARLAIIDKSGKVVILDSASFRREPPLCCAYEVTAPPRTVVPAFSPDGRRLAAPARDGDLAVWDLSTRRSKPGGQKVEVAAVAFNADGTRLVTGGRDGTIRLWDGALAERPQTLGKHDASADAVTFSPDGTRVASGSSDGTAKIWDVSSGSELSTLRGHVGNVRAVTFSPDGVRLATAGGDRTGRIWDAASGRELSRLSGHTDDIMDIKFSPDGAWVATASQDRTARLWDPASGRERLRFSGHSDEVNGVAFTPDGTRLVTASLDETVKVWDVTSEYGLPTLSGHERGVYGVAFSPDGKKLATASADGTARVWDAAFGDELLAFSGPRQKAVVYGVAFSPDGQSLATASADRTVRIWSATTGKELHVLRGHRDEVNAVTYSRDGKRLATASDDGTVRLWDADGRQLRELDHPQAVWAVAFSQDGKWLATGSADGIARLWDASSGKLQREFRGHAGTVFSVAFSPEGDRLATASADRTARLWNVASRKELLRLSGHTEAVFSVAFSPDGRHIATGSFDKSVILWDAKSGREVLSFEAHTDRVHGIAFRPDGKWLASAGADGMVRTYPLGKEELISLAIARLRRPLEDSESLIDRIPRQDVHAVGLLVEGRKMALTQEPDRTADIFRKAQQSAPKLELNPELIAGRLIAAGLIVKARALASAGEVAKSADNFRRARQLDPTLGFDPGVEASRLAASSLVARGNNQAVAGDVAGAEASFGRAMKLHPALGLDPKALARRLAVPPLLARGRREAAAGNVEAAISSFRQAKDLDPASVELDPQTEAHRLAASSLVERAQGLARAGAVQSASDLFRQVVKLNPSLRIDPDVEARKWAVASLLQRGCSQVYRGDLDGALVNYQKAKELDPRIDPKAEIRQCEVRRLVGTVADLLGQGRFREALARFQEEEKRDPDLDVPGWVWNNLCWQGSLRGYAAEVLRLCEKAVALEPQNWAFLDSRGLARALTGDYQGAIRDFQPFIESSGRPDETAQRRRWVDALRAGRNPFTPEELKILLLQ